MRPRTKRRIAKTFKSIFIYAVLIVAVIGAIFPVLWAVSTSLKVPTNIATFPPQWIPNPITLAHYDLTLPSMARYIINNVIVAAGTIVLTLLIASHGGYAAARSDFPLKNTLLFIILSTMMIPGIAVLIPLYMVASKLNLLDTHSVLIIIFSAWQIPLVLWLLKGFFETIPVELEEAAMIDGCSQLGAMYRISMPLIRPGLAAAAIVVFVYVWNEFIIALTLTTSDKARMITVGLYYYLTAYGIEWGKLMSAVVLALIPVMVLFLILQRQFIQGLVAGARKG